MSKFDTMIIEPPDSVLQAGLVLKQQYQLQQQLGKNIGRQTWYAHDISVFPAKPVILKLLALNPHIQWNDIRLFEREAVTLKYLKHQFIPQYLDHFSIDNQLLWFALVHTYISGDSLANLLKAGRKFSDEELHHIVVSLLDILIYLHELNPAVLHRDIKPSNIILTESGNIYLIDFGAVQAHIPQEGATFTIVGTYGYAPIEQFGGRAVPASDLYSLGATIIHLITGIAPAELPHQNMRIQFQQYLNISSSFKNWIEHLTEPSVEQRCQTARQALALLSNPSPRNIMLTLPKPSNSKIQIRKSPYKLEFKIPKRGIHPRDFFALSWIVLIYLATIPFSKVIFSFAVLFWIIGLIPLGMMIFLIFGEFHLSLNQNNLTLQWKIFDLCFRSLPINTNDIRKIHIVSEGSNQSQIVVSTPTTNQPYKFSGAIAPVSEAEKQWLVQELKAWLKLDP